MKLTLEKALELWDENRIKDVEYSADNCTQGIQILLKYADPCKEIIISSSHHDVIGFGHISDWIDRGMTVEDAEALVKLNWHLEDDEYLNCFV